MPKPKNDFIFKVKGNIEVLDKVTHSKRTFFFRDFNMLKDLDLKYDWGIFFLKKEKKE